MELKKQEDIVRASLRSGETLLWWSGEEHAAPLKGKQAEAFEFVSKILGLGTLAGVFVLGDTNSFVWTMLMGIVGIILVFWNSLYGYINRNWQYRVIVTDQRVILPGSSVKGSDIQTIQQGFVENGAVRLQLVLPKGKVIEVPVADYSKLKALIEQQFLQGASA